MPLVAHSDLPSFERLRAAGQEVLTLERARSQDIRELHIGLLNMMPDAALEATERQFMRLVGSCNRIAQIHVHPFAVDAGVRGPEGARAHRSSLRIVRRRTLQGSGRPHHLRRESGAAGDGRRAVLAAARRGHGVGGRARLLGGVLVPGDPRLSAALSWCRAPAMPSRQAMGRLRAPQRGRPSTGLQPEYPASMRRTRTSTR